MSVIAELLPAIFSELPIYLPSIFLPLLCFVIAYRLRNKNTPFFYGFVLASLASILITIVILYDMYASPTAQSVLGLLSIPILSLGAVCVVLAITGLFRILQPFLHVKQTARTYPKYRKTLLLLAILLLVGTCCFVVYDTSVLAYKYLGEDTTNQDVIRALEKKAFKEHDEEMMSSLAQNKNTPTDVLDSMALYVPTYIFHYLMENPNASMQLKERGANYLNLQNGKIKRNKRTEP